MRYIFGSDIRIGSKITLKLFHSYEIQEDRKNSNGCNANTTC